MMDFCLARAKTLRSGDQLEANFDLVLSLEDPGDAYGTEAEVAHQEARFAAGGESITVDSYRGIDGDRFRNLPDGQVTMDLKSVFLSPLVRVR